MNQLGRDRLQDERYRALAASERHLNQVLYHLRALHNYNQHAGLQLDLPSEKQITDAMSQCARLHQLDKEKVNENVSSNS